MVPSGNLTRNLMVFLAQTCRQLHHFRAGILTPSTADVLGPMILCLKDCPLHCRMFSSTPGLYPLEANIASDHLSETKMSPSVARCPLGAHRPCLEARLLALFKSLQLPPLICLLCQFWYFGSTLWGSITQWDLSKPHVYGIFFRMLTSRWRHIFSQKRQCLETWFHLDRGIFWIILSDLDTFR